MKNKFCENKGITLLALIITILVMLILAGVSISMIVGEDGVIAQAKKASEEQKIAELKDYKDLWWNQLKISNYGLNENVQDLESLVKDLKNKGLITEEEANDILTTGQLKFDLTDETVVFYEVGKNRGKYVKFAGQTWRILYDDVYSKESHGLQVVPISSFGDKITIGYDDDSNQNDNTDIDKAIESYNDYIKTLNKVCRDLVPYSPAIQSVRSIGTNPIIGKQDELPSKTFKSTFLETWENGKYKDYNEGKIIESFKNDSDSDALAKIQYLKPDEEVWYANNSTNDKAKYEDPTKEGLHLDIRTVKNSDAISTWYSIIRFAEYYKNENHMASPISMRVLPVVTIKQGFVQFLKGDGTQENPFIIPE